MRLMTNNRLFDLIHKVEGTQWHEQERAAWLLGFLCLLIKLAPSVRRSTPRGKRAAQRLAWHAGQLIDIPERMRDDEAESQQFQRESFERAVDLNRKFGIPIRDSVRWDAETAAAEVRGAFSDTQKCNRLMHRMLVDFGVLDPVRDALLEMHSSFAKDAGNLFCQDFWPSWWTWAQPNFFGGSEPSKPAAA